MLASQRPAVVRAATGLRQCRSPINLSLRRFSSNLKFQRQPLAIQQSSSRPSLYMNTRKPIHLSIPSLLRFKSTGPEVLTDSQINAGANTSSFDSFSDHLIPDNIPAVTSSLNEYTNGYLNSLGIDHGWGPTSIMQWLLEHIHVLSGFEWPASILISAVIFRLVTFPVHLKTTDNAARIRELMPHMAELNAKMREASASGDMHSMAIAKSELSERYKAAKCSPLRGLGTFALIPFAYGNFVLIRHMCAVPVPSLEHQGFLWLHDLTSVDPTYTLPMISAACLCLTFKLGGESANTAMPVSENTKKFLMYGLPLISFSFMAFMPSALSLHFAMVSSISLLQAYLFRNETFRAMLGLYPYKPVGLRTDQPTHDTVNTLRLAKHAKREIKSQQLLIEAKNKEAQAGGGSLMGLLSTYAGGSSGNIMQSSKDRQAQKMRERSHEQYEKRAAEEDERRQARKRKLRSIRR